MSAKPYAVPQGDHVEIGLEYDGDRRKRTPLFYLKAHECAELIRDVNRASSKLTEDK